MARAFPGAPCRSVQEVWTNCVMAFCGSSANAHVVHSHGSRKTLLSFRIGLASLDLTSLVLLVTSSPSSYEAVESGLQEELPCCTRQRMGCSVPPRYPRPLRSKNSIVLRFASPAPASPANPSVRRGHPPQGSRVQCLFHRRESAAETRDHRTGCQLQCGGPVRGGTHFAAVRGRFGRLHPVGGVQIPPVIV